MLEEVRDIMERVLEGQHAIEITERIIAIVEKSDDQEAIDYCKEALNHCKKELNKLEYELIIEMEYYIREYKINEERNYGPRLNTEE